MDKRKKTILNVGYGKVDLVKEYYRGGMSSRHFYGSIELEKSGRYNVVNVSLDSTPGIKGVIRNNLMMLKSADVIFVPYFFVAPFFLLSILKHLGLTRKKLVAICHTTMKSGNCMMRTLYYKMIYSSFDMCFFHSQLNMEESISCRLIKSNKTRFLYWGDDLSFIDKTYPIINQGAFFISTGREQRDFKSLITVFEKEQYELEIYTNKTNPGFDYLRKQVGMYDNIHIEFLEKKNTPTEKLTKRTSECLCVVVPVIEESMNYCVGLTSIVEAMALGKPIICNYNPYSPIDIKGEGIGIVVDNKTSWKDAIEYIATHRDEANEMGIRGRRLAERKFNINRCVSQLEEVIIDIC